MKLRLIFAIPVLVLLVVLAIDTASIYSSTRQLSCSDLYPQLTSKELNYLNGQLNKKFTNQEDGSYISEDKTLLIKKTLNMPARKPTKWRRLLPGFVAISKRCKQLEQKANLQRACLTAYNRVSQDFGLLYYQFAPTTYFNRFIGEIDLCQDSYYIQRAATPSQNYLANAPIEDAKLAVTQLFDFALRCTKGRLNMPLDQLDKDIGFACGRPIYINLTKLSYNRKWRRQNKRDQTNKRLNMMQNWILKTRPELIPHYQTLLEELN